jgi:hypothetical protein
VKAVSSIQTGIELQDNFTGVLYNIINSVNMAVSTMEDMQRTMNADIDTSSFEGMRSEINQATVALDELNAAMQSSASEIEAPTVEQPVVDIPTDTVINADVNPVIPDPLVENPEPIRPEIQPNAPPDPVEVPVKWQADNLEVFTNTGIERFEQEVQSANNMLNTLNSTQQQIQQTASGIDILPDTAIQDISNMQQRLQAIQTRIQQISTNKLNMGVDAANDEMEQLRSQLNSAIQEQEELNAAMQNMDVSSANAAYLRLSQTISGTERYIRDNVNEQGVFNRSIQQGTNNASELNSMISKAVGAFAGLFGIKQVIGFVSDSMDLFDTQLNAETQLMGVLANMLDDDYVSNYMIETNVTADTSDAISEINDIQNNVDDVEITVQARTDALQAEFDAITEKASEIQSKGIYGDEAMIAGAAELSTYFTDTDAIEMMMDTLSNYAMGMSGGGELDATAMTDYATGLGKVMTGAYDAMTKKGFEFTEAQQAIIEGTATEEQIAAQLGAEYVDMSDDMQAAAAITQVIDESWAGLYETMSDTPQGKIIQMTNAWGDMKEVIGSQLYPYVILFVDTITENWGTIETIIEGFVTGLQDIMAILDWLLQGVTGIASVIIDNWSVIQPIVLGIVAALAAYAAISAIVAVVNGVMAASEAVHAASAAMAAGATFAQTAAQYGLNAALLACPVTWIIIAIIAIIALIYAVCQKIAELTGIANSGFGVITGGINVVIQFFKNLGLEVANIALGIGNAIAALASNMMTAFHNAICSVQSWFYNLLSTALTVIEGICEALNKLPFVEFDYSGITSAADDYAAKASEAAGNKEDYTSISDAFNEGMSTFDTFQDGWASDAFEARASWGDGVADAVSNFSLTDALGLDVGSASDYTVSASDYSSALNSSGIGSDLDDIASDTGSISDSLDITDEDLKYLRDIAEQEAINRYTTAEITIEQTNNNTVKGDMDLDGLVTGLTDAVNEAVDIITEGVHD